MSPNLPAQGDPTVTNSQVRPSLAVGAKLQCDDGRLVTILRFREHSVGNRRP